MRPIEVGMRVKWGRATEAPYKVLAVHGSWAWVLRLAPDAAERGVVVPVAELHPLPPVAVGDRVKTEFSGVGTVLAVDGGFAWVMTNAGPLTFSMSLLEVLS